MIDFDDTTTLIDQGMVSSLDLYYRYGLHPGSFGEALLLGNEILARSRAFHYHRLSSSQGQDIVANMLIFVECYPFFCRGSEETINRWMSHDGLSGASDEIKVLCKLTE